jgi:putative acetyltransferase
MLWELEQCARELGRHRLLLETGDRQPDAIRFCEREGYTRIPNYGHYVDSPLSLCYELVP